MTTHIRFYFDYMSPYAYANYVNLQRLLKEYAGQLVVTYHPVSFPAISRAWGSTPTSSVPPKLAFIFKDLYRITRNRHMPFSVPAKFPFPTGLLLCLSSLAVGGIDQPRIIAAIWQAIWGNPSGQGADLADEEVLKKLLNDLGLDADGLLSYAKSDMIRKELLDATTEAVQKFKILAIRNLLDGGTDHMRSAPDALRTFLKNIPDKTPKVEPKPKSLPQAKL